MLLLDEQQGGFEVVPFGGRQLRRAAFPQPLAKTAFAADGAFLAGVTGLGSDDERVAIMSVADDTFVWQSTERTRGSRQLLFLENPSRLVQLADRALVYDHADGRVLSALPPLDGSGDARVATVSPDGATLAVTTSRGHLTFVSTSDGSRRDGCQ